MHYIAVAKQKRAHVVLLYTGAKPTGGGGVGLDLPHKIVMTAELGIRARVRVCLGLRAYDPGFFKQQ